MLPPRRSNSFSSSVDAIPLGAVARLPSPESLEESPAGSFDPAGFASISASTEYFNYEVDSDNDRKPSPLPRHEASESEVSEPDTPRIIPGERLASRPSKRLRRENGTTGDDPRLTELPLEVLRMTAPYLQSKEVKYWAISHRIFNDPSLRSGNRYCQPLSMEMVDKLIQCPGIPNKEVQLATSVKLPKEICNIKLEKLISSGQLNHITGMYLSGCNNLDKVNKRRSPEAYVCHQLFRLKSLKKN